MPVRRVSFIAGIAVLALSIHVPAFAQTFNSKVDRGLRAALQQGGATQKVIVTVNPGCHDFVRTSLQNHGDRVKSDHPLIDAIAVDLHSDDVAELSNHPCVKTLSYDAPVTTTSSSGTWGGVRGGDPRNARNRTWNSTSSTSVSNPLRETLGLPAVPGSSTPTGDAGVGVAIIDSGIAPLADFTGRITGFYDFTKGGIPTTPYDDYGHGTHIAGLIGSSGKLAGNAVMGIAPDVRLVGLKVLDGTGAGNTSDVIKALEYVVANRSRLNVQIVNLSLGHPIFAPAADDPLVQAVEQASAAGLIVVTAAGNYGQVQHGDGAPTKNADTGYTGITSPGNAPSAITVGAVMTQDTTTRGDDVVAPYSSRGPSWYDAFAKPDVVAPGHSLVADASSTSYLYKKLATSRVQVNGNPFLSLSGTSMATGVTSGVVALLVQAHNQNGLRDRTPLTPNLVKAMLEYSAIPLAGFDYLTQGAGEINAAGAIALARAIDTDAPRGSWWLSAGVSPSTSIGGTSYVWGQNIVWGTTVRTGDAIYSNNILWGTNIVWGTNVVWGTLGTVRAANIVWGTVAVWASNIVWGDRLVGMMSADENIVWGTFKTDAQNILWGTLNASNIVWGTRVNGNNILWGTLKGSNILWGTSWGDENVVWGTSLDENVVWGTSEDENVVWGTSLNASTSSLQ